MTEMGEDAWAAILKEVQSLRGHLTTLDGGRHLENVRRMEQIETDQKEQLKILNQIQQQTACIPDLRKQQEDHEDRIDDLESTRDTLKGGKFVIGFIAMLGSSALGAWISSLLKRH